MSTNAEKIKKLLDITKKKNKELAKYTSTLSDSIYSNISEFIDTGSHSLNGLISGNIFNGIPRGRVVGFGGASGSGKSRACGRVIANAQKMGYIPVVLDSENAIDMNFMSNLGCNTDEFVHVLIDTYQEVRDMLHELMSNNNISLDMVE